MLRITLPLILLLIALPATADHQTLICSDCRDVRSHPTDFGNHAFNELIEPLDNDFSMFTTYSTSTYIWNRQQQWALVLLEDIIENVGITVTWGGVNIPIQISTDFVRITVQDQYGSTTSYEVIETSMPLSVGNGTATPPPAPATPSKPQGTGSGQDVSNPASGSAGGGLCCQIGAFYWYYDMPEFEMRFSNE